MAKGADTNLQKFEQRKKKKNASQITKSEHIRYNKPSVFVYDVKTAEYTL